MAPPRCAEALALILVILLINTSVTDVLNMAKNSQKNTLEAAFDVLQGQEDLHIGEEDLALTVWVVHVSTCVCGESTQ